MLYLYGYTSQQIDGLSFPDDVAEPDKENVAAVTLEVMTVRSEVDMLLKVSRCVSELLFFRFSLIFAMIHFLCLCLFRAFILTPNTSSTSSRSSTSRCVPTSAPEL